MNFQDITSVTFGWNDLINKVKEGTPFDFSRYGDGEFECMFNKRNRPMNSDLHRYYPDLAEALIRVLMDSPNYYLGLQSLAYRQKTDIINDLTEKYGLRWFKSNFIHNRNQKFGLQDYFDVLKTRKVVIVGPPHLRKIDQYFPYDSFIETPLQNAWLAKDKIAEQIDKVIDDAVISYSCGMMKCVLINQFHGRGTQLDNGSIFDPHCGVNTRSYHFDMEAGKGNESSAYFKMRNR